MTRRRLSIAGGVLLLVGGGIGAVALAGGGAARLAVQTEAVSARDLVATITANGWIRPRRSVDVQAAIMGRVVDLAVEEGDSVDAGELLLRIDPTQYEASVARARAAVSEARAREAQARASFLQAELALDRLNRLRSQDSTLVSGQAWDEATAQVEIQRALLEAARFGVEQTRAALREAEDRLSKTVIRSPIDGVVTRLSVEQGETAIVGTMNNPGSLLLTVSDLSVMEAVVQVDETDVPRIRLGDSAFVEIDAFPDQVFIGRVTEIGHSAIRPPASMARSGQTVQAIDFEVVITLDDPPSSLRPDLSATADIVTATRDSALSVPIIALTVRERPAADSLAERGPAAAASDNGVAPALDPDARDVEGVFVIRDGVAHFTPVRVGIPGQLHFEIVSGLEPGDTIVSGPYEAIRELTDGAAIRILTTDPDTAETAEGG